jgi:PTH1 family peptidyl-tRNA hydrolase
VISLYWFCSFLDEEFLMISAVAFLGNHGRKYQQNRHNIAWLFARNLSFLSDIYFQTKFNGQMGSIQHFADREEPLYFLFPETYMNLSGQSIGPLLSFYKLKPENLLVVHDELELPLGTVSLKWAGGLGGHNGLRSTKECLGTADFWRLRLGIGRPVHGDVSNWVLSDFTDDESIILGQVFAQMDDFFLQLLTKNPENLAKKWQKQNLLV